MARESYVATRGTSTAVRKRCSSVAVKRIWAVLLLALCSCSKHRSGVSGLAGADADAAWLATTGASSLARTFRALGLDVTERGQAVLVAGKRVNVTARIDDKVKRDDRNFLAAEFGILVDGKRIPALTTGAIGVDDTPEHARHTTATEWASEYGAPIGFALATQFGGRAHPSATDSIAPLYLRLDVDGQVLFHGPPGLRGNAKSPGEASSDAFIRTIATSVVSVLRTTPAVSEYRSATVLVVVAGTAVTGGECRIDGAVSPELLRAFSKVGWPEGSPSYMFKMFFVGVPRHG